MEITCTNFNEHHARIEDVIKNASFIAFDLEFLGLEDEESHRKCSLFDTPQERYEKTLHSVRRFPPAQLGLAFFTELNDGEKYKVDVFTIYLFKTVSFGRDYSFSVSSLEFLQEHGFDFNKLTRSGVSHYNLDELQRVLNRFHQPNGVEIFGRDLPQLLHHLQKLIKSEVARVRRKSTGSEGAEQNSWTCITIAITQKLNEMQRAVILYKLHGCTPGTRMEINGQLLLVYPEGKADAREDKKSLFEKITRELMCASDIVMAIIDAKLPIVGHNSFRDVLYLYEYFVADLPDSLDDFKRALTGVFQLVIDTKILAEECKNRLSWHGVMNYRLESLNAFFDRMSQDSAVPSPIYEYSEDVEQKFRNPDSASMHEAGVDAVSTGQTFLRLSYLVAMQERESIAFQPFRTLLYSIRPVSNRLPVPLLGAPYVNLLGAEPPSRNPDAIILEMIAHDDTAGLGALRRELRGKFGRWRCDVRKHDDNKIHVATNTDTTYWRVFKYYSMHPSYRVLSLPTEDSRSTASDSDSSYSTPARPLSPADMNNRLPLALPQFLLDLTPVPAVKWWLTACTCIVVTNILSRRNSGLI